MITRYFKRTDWILISAAVACIFASVYFDLRIPEYMSEITYNLQNGSGPSVIAECGASMVVCAVLSLVFSFGTSTLSSRAASSLCRTLRERQFRNISTWSRQDIDGFSAASLITRSTNDAYQIQQFIGRAITSMVKAPVLGVWAVLKIASSDFQWTAITAVSFGILLVCTTTLVTRSMPFTRKMQWHIDSVNSETRQELVGMRTIRAFNAEDRMQKEFDEASEALFNNSMSAERYLSALHPMAGAVQNFLTMGIYWVGMCVIASAGSTDQQMLLFSDMIVFTTYAAKVLGSAMIAVGIMRSVPGYLVSARRVEEVIRHESSVKDGDARASDATEPGSVSFEHVSFTYPGTHRKVLDDVSFSIGKGQTLAIIGPTAGGKSTIAQLIPRLYDATSGTVRVGGLDTRSYSEKELSSMVGYVPQSTVIFSGSLRRNIAFGLEDCSDEEILRALRIAQLDDLVSKLPEGLDTDILQHGWNLSGGQKQRISIARAVCRRPSVFVFDDTFSALDFRTDRDLRDALEKETAGSTRIIIAQRVGTIMDADRILVIDEGRIVGDGRHPDLMQTCELYREIAQSQLEDFDDRCREGCETDAVRTQMGEGSLEAQEPDRCHEDTSRSDEARHQSADRRNRMPPSVHADLHHRPQDPGDRHRRDIEIDIGFPAPRHRGHRRHAHGPGPDVRRRVRTLLFRMVLRVPRIPETRGSS